MELWKPIKNYEGSYEVSNYGNIKSYLKNPKGKIQKNTGHSLGYKRANLTDRNGKKVTKYIHVLVAEAFLGPRPKGKEVNHKDLDKSNNNVNNLEYVDHKTNIIHALKLKNRYKGYTYEYPKNGVIIAKSCKCCGIKFWSGMSWQKYCSKKCYRFANRNYNKDYYRLNKDKWEYKYDELL